MADVLPLLALPLVVLLAFLLLVCSPLAAFFVVIIVAPALLIGAAVAPDRGRGQGTLEAVRGHRKCLEAEAWRQSSSSGPPRSSLNRRKEKQIESD